MVKREMPEQESVRTKPRRFCPFVKEPFDECLCSGTSSDSAEAAIRLCGGDFEACEIYRKWRWEGRFPAGS